MRQLEAGSDDPAFFLIASLSAMLYLLIAVTWLAVFIGIAKSEK
ncbi:hypothetical protein MITS9508_02444 [Synechococcus sp. MIT S9508]|nr:hypothetical protein MITS9508_02444 [Synechococcus sp. MIT S9508]